VHSCVQSPAVASHWQPPRPAEDLPPADWLAHLALARWVVRELAAAGKTQADSYRQQ